MRSTFAFAALLAVLAGTCRADGKMYWPEKVPPSIPYQRALILFHEGTETLIVQSQYEVPKDTIEAKSIGWIVPVPAPPDVESIPASEASILFHDLGWGASPQAFQVVPWLCLAFPPVLAVTGILALLLWLDSKSAQSPDWCRRHRRWLVAYAGVACCLFIPLAALRNSLAVAGEGGPVEVISTHHTGIHDVQVVQSEDSQALIAWLNTNGFHFGPEDTATFDTYIARKWCFVVATLAAGADNGQKVSRWEGLAAPLVLTFPAANPVYPMALTATVGQPTEVALYLVSDRKMTCDGRLALRYAAGHSLGRPLGDILLATEPTKRLIYAEGEPTTSEEWMQLVDHHPFYGYLCKFRDRLIPAQMAEDIVFHPAPDDEPYRERVVRWW